MDTVKEDLNKRMAATVKNFEEDLKGLRTGRCSPQLLEPVMVEAYGSHLPLSQVGTIQILEPRLLGVQVWDSGVVKAVDKAIRDANLGLNPSIDGLLVRVPLPDLTQERRKELVKLAHKYAEQARISIRSVRRDGMDITKKKDFSEDESKRLADEIQKTTDSFVQKIDQILTQKEQDILAL